MRVAIVYDCMFPYTIGGAERWYVHVAERLAEDNDVTYVTLRQWPKGESPKARFAVVEVGPRLELYTESGRRKIWPPLRFGIGVFWHLLLRGGRYDVVHGASFPYFSVIGAWVALLFHPRTKLVIDWHEVWSRTYWREYLGTIGGRVGHAVQALCMRLADHNFTVSRLHTDRLKSRHVTRLTGEFVEGKRPAAAGSASAPPRAVFAGRHIPEKNVTTIPAAIVEARKIVPNLEAKIFGGGPESERVLAEVERLNAASFVDLPGRVDREVLDEAFSTAACMVLPSEREGYGLVVLESVSVGTPVVLVAGEDNAATELVDDGVNGFVAESTEPTSLGKAIANAVGGGDALRASTWNWYEARREELSIDDSLGRIRKVYSSLVKR